MNAERLPAAPGIATLLEDWEQMSARFLPGREVLLGQAIEWLRTTRPAASVVEIGAGPGTTLRTLRRALPGARLVGLDQDPVLRELHRLATPAWQSIETIEADLWDRAWTSALPAAAPVTTVIAIQVLHYFPAPRFAEILAEIRGSLASEGTLIHLDIVGSDEAGEASAIAPRTEGESDPWQEWWGRAARSPALAEAFAARAAATGRVRPSAEYHPDQHELDQHLASAGFGSVAYRARDGASLLTIASR